MADVQITRNIRIQAETLGDVAKWMAAVEDEAGSTRLAEPAILEIELEEKKSSSP